MYILRISPRAFIRCEENGDTTIVASPDKASTYDTIGDAMRAAIDMNDLLETNKVAVFPLQLEALSFSERSRWGVGGQVPHKERSGFRGSHDSDRLVYRFQYLSFQ